MPELSDKAIDILMQEYATLREEIKERLKIAFSHVAYAGASAAFVLPAADKLSGWGPRPLTFVCAAAALFGLGWVAYLNMRWVQHCGVRIRKIEEKINGRFGTDVLGWEQYASSVQASRWFRIPVAAPRPHSVDGSLGLALRRPRLRRKLGAVLAVAYLSEPMRGMIRARQYTMSADLRLSYPA